MQLTYQQIEKKRFLDSLVYKFHVFADGELLQEETLGANEGDPSEWNPIVYSIQVQDGCCVKGAMLRMLAEIKANLEGDPTGIPDLPMVSLEEEAEG
jgi:hypothetical protein